MSAGLLTADFTKQFVNGPRVHAVLTLPTDSFSITVLFGPSGSGKTTVLRCLAGLERPNEGFIRLGAETWFDAGRGVCVPPQKRGIGYLFQDYALFPHLTVLANVGYGLHSIGRAERRRRATEICQVVGLTGLEHRYPHQLSGGQQQRAALARALARRPSLMLLDEPLSALDAPARAQLRRELRSLLAPRASATLLVTHDRVEALAVGDKVLILEEGRICQSGPIHEVFARPQTPSIARIVGMDTILPAEISSTSEGLTTISVGQVRMLASAAGLRPGPCTVCIRAEDVILERGASLATSARNRFTGRVTQVFLEGPMARVGMDCGFRLTALITNHAYRELGLAEGEVVTAHIKASAIHIIPRS
jgi:molybdate transport system ATP-binding protein